MKKDLAAAALALAGSLAVAPWVLAHESGGSPDARQSVQSREMPQQVGQVQNQGQLRAAADFPGMQVHDRQGREIGKVDRLIVDPGAGRMAYVVVSAGGKQVIVPWNALQMQQAGSGEKNV